MFLYSVCLLIPLLLSTLSSVNANCQPEKQLIYKDSPLVRSTLRLSDIIDKNALAIVYTIPNSDGNDSIEMKFEKNTDDPDSVIFYIVLAKKSVKVYDKDYNVTGTDVVTHHIKDVVNTLIVWLADRETVKIMVGITPTSFILLNMTYNFDTTDKLRLTYSSNIDGYLPGELLASFIVSTGHTSLVSCSIDKMTKNLQDTKGDICKLMDICTEGTHICSNGISSNSMATDLRDVEDIVDGQCRNFLYYENPYQNCLPVKQLLYDHGPRVKSRVQLTDISNGKALAIVYNITKFDNDAVIEIKFESDYGGTHFYVVIAMNSVQVYNKDYIEQGFPLALDEPMNNVAVVMVEVLGDTILIRTSNITHSFDVSDMNFENVTELRIRYSSNATKSVSGELLATFILNTPADYKNTTSFGNCAVPSMAQQIQLSGGNMCQLLKACNSRTYGWMPMKTRASDVRRLDRFPQRSIELTTPFEEYEYKTTPLGVINNEVEGVVSEAADSSSFGSLWVILGAVVFVVVVCIICLCVCVKNRETPQPINQRLLMQKNSTQQLYPIQQYPTQPIQQQLSNQPTREI